MTDHSDDQRKREERRRGLDEVDRMLAEAKMAHSMSDAESYEAMLNIDADNIVGDEQERLDQRLKELWHDDTLGMTAFGDDDAWLDKRLDDD